MCTDRDPFDPLNNPPAFDPFHLESSIPCGGYGVPDTCAYYAEEMLREFSGDPQKKD